MNILDLAAALAVVLGLFLGYRVGGARQLSGLLGAALGVGIVIAAGILAADFLATLDPLMRTMLVVGLLIVGFIGGQAVGSSLGAKLANGNEEGAAGVANRLLGAVVGGLEAVVLIWLIGGLITMAPEPQLAKLAQRSAVVQSLASVAPPPTVVAQGLQDQLAASGLPQLFDGVAPLPGQSAKLPSQAKARVMAEKAEPATVKVVGSGCGRQGSGSGVVISKGYVVTNAHVVAGASFIQVESSGRRYEAVPVKVDADLDAALLYAGGLDAPALAFADADPERGDRGVALGYPGGGTFTAVRASVNREILARGRDVYGNVSVTRQVLELNARVNPGNSGGPLVMANGRIGGIIFAESPSDPKVGYALAAEEVEASVKPALGRTRAVSSGPCPT